MNIHTANRKLRQLRDKLLTDGKIDFVETDEILNFILPYVRAKNSKFMMFDHIIRIARADGIISDDDSKNIIAAIDNMIEFLEVESKVETFLVVAFVAIAAIFAICFFI